MNTTPTILKKILERKKQEIIESSSLLSLNELKEKIKDLPKSRAFYQVLKNKNDQCKPAVIAEIKLASPSRGILREPFDPKAIAVDYEKNGAACLSVLTDRYFFRGLMNT